MTKTPQQIRNEVEKDKILLNECGKPVTDYLQGFNDGVRNTEREIKKKISELGYNLISRICRPNKPVDTFENAREQEEIINEEIQELLSKIGDNSEVEK